MISRFSVRQEKQAKNEAKAKKQGQAAIIVLISMGLLFIFGLLPFGTKILVGSVGILAYPAIILVALFSICLQSLLPSFS